MPSAIRYDHKDTLKYLPKHHRTLGLSQSQVKIFKNLEKCYVHEGRTIHPSFLEGTSIRQDLATINFDCLLDIDEPICPRFILEFYATIHLSCDNYGQISLHFTINQHKTTISLEQFAQILGVPNYGTYLFTNKWSLTSLDTIACNSVNASPISKDILRDHLFIRTSHFRKGRSGNIIVKNPYGMELSELKPQFRKWEKVLRSNVMCSISDRNHVNTSLCYMLYSISTRQPFNLAYFMARKMTNISFNRKCALPYGMILTRLFRAISPIPPNNQGILLDYSLVDHILVPLSDERVSLSQGKLLQTRSPSSSSMSDDDIDGLPNDEGTSNPMPVSFGQPSTSFDNWNEMPHGKEL